MNNFQQPRGFRNHHLHGLFSLVYVNGGKTNKIVNNSHGDTLERSNDGALQLNA